MHEVRSTEKGNARPIGPYRPDADARDETAEPCTSLAENRQQGTSSLAKGHGPKGATEYEVGSFFEQVWEALKFA